MEFNSISIYDRIIQYHNDIRCVLGSRGRSLPGHIKNDNAFTPLRLTLSKPSNGSRSNRWSVIHNTPKQVSFILTKTQDTKQRKENENA
jgi:hypothetical protein